MKILWDFMIQCDHMVQQHRKPDIVIVNKEDKQCLIVDVAIPGDNRVEVKEREKVENYGRSQLRREITSMWGMKKVDVVPVVVGVLGAVTPKIRECRVVEVGDRGSESVEHLQKPALSVGTELLEFCEDI